MIRRAFDSLLLYGLFLAVPAFAWSDTAGDTLENATSPALDLVDFTLTFGPQIVVLNLTFNPAATSSGDLDSLSGFVDLDTDLDDNTGRISHIEEYGYEPFPTMGADYYVAFYPFSGIAELFYVSGGDESSIGQYATTVNGTTVSVTIPRCQLNPQDGICIGARHKVAVLVGNADGPTDRAPNDEFALNGIPGPGDFDEDGDVDDNDFDLFKACATRASVAYVPGTFPQGCTLVPDEQGFIPADFDRDHDVDQEDFGVWQRYRTGAY